MLLIRLSLRFTEQALRSFVKTALQLLKSWNAENQEHTLRLIRSGSTQSNVSLDPSVVLFLRFSFSLARMWLPPRMRTTMKCKRSCTLTAKNVAQTYWVRQTNRSKCINCLKNHQFKENVLKFLMYKLFGMFRVSSFSVCNVLLWLESPFCKRI